MCIRDSFWLSSIVLLLYSESLHYSPPEMSVGGGTSCGQGSVVVDRYQKTLCVGLYKITQETDSSRSLDAADNATNVQNYCVCCAVSG